MIISTQVQSFGKIREAEARDGGVGKASAHYVILLYSCHDNSLPIRSQKKLNVQNLVAAVTKLIIQPFFSSPAI